MGKWVGYEYTPERKTTVAAATNPKLLSHIRRLGYLPISAGKVCDKLQEMASSGVGTSEILLHAGWALVCDGEGLWPTAAFAKGLFDFKGKIGVNETARIVTGIETSDLLNLLALSFSCPEIIGPKERETVENAFDDKKYTVLDFDDKGFRTRQMIASYAAPEIEVPWKKDGMLAEKIRNILAVMWNFSVAHSQTATYDELYRTVREYLQGPCRFDNSFNIFSDAEPLDAMRLNIEIANFSGDKMHAYIRDRFERVASMFATLQAGGHNTSVKFTTSDYEPGVTCGKRFCIYVPTCAVERTIIALKDSGLTEGTLDTNRLNNRNSSVFRLPQLVILRSTGEIGSSSIAQANEALDALVRNRVRYEQISFGQPNSIQDVRYRKLEDGTTIDLFQSE